MIETIKQAFKVLEHHFDGIPFDAIEFLYNHEPCDEIIDRAIFHLSNAYDEKFYNDPYITNGLLPTPLWFAIVAERHHNERTIDPVIKLFTTTEDDWDFLNEQGEYLLGLLSEKYPDIVIPKCLDIIEKLSDENSDLPYLFLFDCLYFADAGKYKDILLKILSKDDFTWFGMLAVRLAYLQIKEAIPIIRAKLDKLKIERELYIKKEISGEDLTEDEKEMLIFEGITYAELEEALEELETGQLIDPKLEKPYYKTRSDWMEHYLGFENLFGDDYYDEDEEDYYDDNEEFDDFETIKPVLQLYKTGRNEKCPCGSGKKYKNCCIGKKE